MDRVNLEILAILQSNGRASATAIGEKIFLSRTAVQNRISQMEKEGVIEGYTAIVNSQKQTTIQAVIFATFNSRPCEPVLTWLRSLRSVERVISLSGELDAVIEVRIFDIEDLSKLNDLIGKDQRIKSSQSHIVLSTR